MIEAFLRTCKEIFSPFFWFIIILNLIITAAFFSAIVWGVGELVTHFVANFEWLKSLASWGAIFLSYMLFPIIFPLFSYLFQDFVASHLGKKYNPDQEEIHIPITTVMVYALKFLCLSLFLNLIFLPFYLIPVAGFILYFCLNSYLLGREYYQLSAYSLMQQGEIKAFRKQHSKAIFVSGLVLSLFFLVPVVNLIAPIIGIIFSWFYIFKLMK